MTRAVLRHCAILVLLALPLAAQEDDAPPPPKKEGVQIVFLPPPMDGPLSLGIYDGAGKLVRVLHREATQKDFKVGVNGFITHWDGRDDAGGALPAGKYFARGWTAGDLAVEGVAFHANDWMKAEDGPRYARMVAVKNEGRDEVRVVLRRVDGKETESAWNFAKEGGEAPTMDVSVAVESGKIVATKAGEKRMLPLGEGEKAVAACAGNGGSVWAIVEMAEGREVRAFSAEGEFLRRLACAKDEPVPRQIAASLWGEMIFLLEENAREQRLRALELTTPAKLPPVAEGGGVAPVSEWKVAYQRRIVFSDTFAVVAGALGRKEPLAALPETSVRTRANPLLDGAKSEAKLRVAVDAKGALLTTADGLPLTYLSDTPGLKWVVLVQEGKALLMFQGDGAVVEEFKIGKPSNLMAFDAGEYELRRK